jgi:hypothetical protein
MSHVLSFPPSFVTLSLPCSPLFSNHSGFKSLAIPSQLCRCHRRQGELLIFLHEAWIHSLSLSKSSSLISIALCTHACRGF